MPAIRFGVLRSLPCTLAACAVLAAAAPAQASLTSNDTKDFDIDLPARCTLAKRPLHMLDFNVYDVLCQGLQIGSIYVGSWPTETKKARLIKTGKEFPAFIQVWTADTAGGPAAAKTMASVRPHKGR